MNLAGVEAALYTRSYADFFRRAWLIHEPATPLVWGWAADAVCAHLQALVEDWAMRQSNPAAVQRLQNLLVTLPPGCLKSRLLAYLVPFVWLRWPHLRAIALSCNPRVSLRDSMLANDVISSSWYQQTFRPQWQIRSDSDAKGLFTNTAHGFRAAMGFDARIIGERADLLVIDDPHDPEEADSDTQREHVHQRWADSIQNRVNDLGTSMRVGIAQRTHEDDWSSRRIAEGWAHLDLPMLFEVERACETPLGKPDVRTVEGECLDPVRFPPSVIAAEREKPGGERRWATLYQGRPAPKGGAIVKSEWLRFWRAADKPDAVSSRPSGCSKLPSVVEPAKFDRIAIGVDLAGGKKTAKGDFNVIAVVGCARANFFVLEVWRERADFPEVQRAFRAICARYPRTTGKYVEQQAAGAPLVASLQSEIPGVVAIPSTTGKIERLETVLALFQAGNVHLDEHATWRDYAVHELTTVPASRFDDLTDAIVLALMNLGGRSSMERFRALAYGPPPRAVTAEEDADRTAREAAKRELDERMDGPWHSLVRGGSMPLSDSERREFTQWLAARGR